MSSADAFVSNRYERKVIRFGAKARLFEEFLYSQVQAQVQAGESRPGLMTKAQAQALGDEAKARAIYLKLRVESMRALPRLAPPSSQRGTSDGAFFVSVPASWRDPRPLAGRRFRGLIF